MGRRPAARKRVAQETEETAFSEWEVSRGSVKQDGKTTDRRSLSMSRFLWLSLWLGLVTPSASIGQDEPVFEGQSLRSWVQSLKTGDDQARRHAAQVLGLMGPGVEAAIPDL